MQVTPGMKIPPGMKIDYLNGPMEYIDSRVVEYVNDHLAMLPKDKFPKLTLDDAAAVLQGVCDHRELDDEQVSVLSELGQEFTDALNDSGLVPDGYYAGYDGEIGGWGIWEIGS